MKIKISHNQSAFTLIEVLVVLFVAAIGISLFACLFSYPILGLFPFGPEKTVTAKVERLYVDNLGESGSAYMVGTDQGVFEVSNSLWIWLWDADERYSKLKQGESYALTVNGRKVLNMLFQEYPGIIAVEKLE